jgi:hypothetical protein
MEIILAILRIICVGAVYFVLGALLLGLTGSVLFLMLYLRSLVIKSWMMEHQEKCSEHSDEYARLHAEIDAFLAQIREEM